MTQRRNNRKTQLPKNSFNIFSVAVKSLSAVFFIMLGGLLFNLDRMEDTGILLLKYKAFLPGHVLKFLPGGTAASGRVAAHQEITGKVIEVYDGDTITVLSPENMKYRVRFYGIDAPEAAQEYGITSRDILREKILGKNVAVKVMDVDRYQRAVGKVTAGSRYINLEMVREGAAWHYTAYAGNSFDLYEAEKAARKQKLGLWIDSDPQEPWQWRRENKK